MGIIINVTGGPTLSLYEVNEASTLITEAAHEDAEIIFGAVIDDSLTDEIRVTVIATGFENRSAASHAVEQMSDIHKAMAQSQTINYQVPSMEFVPSHMVSPVHASVPPLEPTYHQSMSHTMPQQPMQQQQQNMMPPVPQSTYANFNPNQYNPPVREQNVMSPSEFLTPQGLPPIPAATQRQVQEQMAEKAAELGFDERTETLLPRERLLAKARAYREQQNRGPSHPQGVGEQLALDVNQGPGSESSRHLAEELIRSPFDNNKLDVPAYIRRQQRQDGEN
jgi:cell division protein FtsZ